MSLGALWYEVSPYAYSVFGMASAMFSNSDFGFFSCALLLAASLAILRSRRIHRSSGGPELRKYARPR